MGLLTGVIQFAAHTVEDGDLIGDDTEHTIRGSGIEAPGTEVFLGAGEEEGAGLMQGVQTLEIDAGAVHDVGGAGFENQQVEHVDIVQLAVGDVDEAGDGSS